MSSLAPKIGEQALPGTPAHEWANETLLSAGQSNPTPHEQIIACSTAASTPGPEFPGAYPREVEVRTNHAREGSAGVLEMAKQYFPVQEDVEKALKNAAETAKQYLPQAVVSYFPDTHPTASLPSQERGDKATASNIGVGSLPGSISESSVAKLPDERLQEEKGSAVGGVGDLPGTKSETEVAKLPAERIQELTVSTSRDPHESVSRASTMAQAGTDSSRSSPPLTPTGQSARLELQPSNGAGGVGDLPGSKAETTVALLPDERKEAQSPPQTSAQPKATEPRINLEPRTYPLAAEGAQWKGVPSDKSHEAYLDANSDKKFNQDAATKSPDTSQGSALNSVVADAGHERPPATLPKAGESINTPERHEKVASDQDTLAPTSSQSDGSGSSGSPRKTRFMDKIKGEVKVISGKLGGKEEKVEEGRRLMGKV